VVLAAIWFIVPSGNSEKIFKYAIGIFIISVIISTFNVSFTKEIYEFPAINTSGVIVNAEKISIETSKYVLETLLNKCDIKFKEVEVFMDNEDSSDINITKARVDFANAEDFNIAAEIIKKQTGIILVR
jgi:hypothetical protein